MTQQALKLYIHLASHGHALRRDGELLKVSPHPGDTSALRAHKAGLLALADRVNRQRWTVAADARGGVSVIESQRVPAALALAVCRGEGR